MRALSTWLGGRVASRRRSSVRRSALPDLFARLGLRGKLLLLVVCVLAPAVALGAVNIGRRAQQYTQERMRDDLVYAGAVATAWDNHVHDVWSTELPVGLIMASSTAPVDRARAAMLLGAVMLDFPPARYANWLGPDGVCLASTDPAAVGLSFAGRKFFERIRAGNDEVTSGVFAAPDDGIPNVVVARAIRVNGQVVGVVALSEDVQLLGLVLPRLSVRGRDFGLVDSDGSIVFQSDAPALPMSRRPLPPGGPVRATLGNGTSTISSRMPSPVDGVSRLGGAAPVADIGWAAFSTSPVAAVAQEARDEELGAVAALVLVAVGAGGGALWLGARMLGPLRALQRAAVAIADGDWDARVPVRGRDELAHTAAAFNHMADRVRALEAELERFFTQSGDLFVIVGPDGRIRRCNPAWQRTLGYAADELDGRDWLDLVDAAERARLDLAPGRFADGTTLSYDSLRMRCKDGSWRWVTWSATIHAAMIYAVGHDITAGREARQALAARIQQQAAVARLGQIALAGADIPELMRQALALAQETLGLDGGIVMEVRGHPPHLEIAASRGAPDHAVTAATGAAQAYRSGGTLVSSGIPSRCCMPIHGGAGPVGAWALQCEGSRTFSVEDLHFAEAMANVMGAAMDRKRGEQALAESNERFAVLVAASPVPIVTTDGAVVTGWNPAAERVFGWAEAEVLGRPVPFQHPDPPAESGVLIDGLLGGEPTVRANVRVARRDGTQVDLIATAALLADSRGTPMGTVSVYVDVTDRNRFLQVAAHELRNPMAAVKGMLGVMRRRAERGAPVEDVVRVADVVEREVDRLAVLLSQILDAFRAQEGRLVIQRQRVDLAQVVRAACRPFAAAVEGSRRLVVEGADGGPVRLLGDDLRLEDVVRNLLSNAFKYSPEGSDVRVALTVGQRGARISVTDCGRGIASPHRERIFEPFYRAADLGPDDPGGLGLGLYVCRDIVRQHGGEIHVHSEAGVGTTFCVDLPWDTADTATVP